MSLADDLSPYPGVPPFRMQDRHLFFGRRAERAVVESLALATPLSLLHATSGAGKTSLINAEFVPRLEDRGVICVVARPFDNPERTLVEETIARVLPAPQHEAEALRRALRALKAEGVSDTIGLRAFRDAVNEKLKDRREYLTIRGPLSVPKARFCPRGEAVPFVVRFLIGNGRPLLLARHISALSRYVGVEPPVSDNEKELIDQLAHVPVGALIEFFDDDRLDRTHETLLRSLTNNATSLADFFDRLVLLWGGVLENFSLVLVLDQFEEMFTRFRNRANREEDPGEEGGGGEVPIGRRDAYFRELADLLPSVSSASRLPVNILVSMRDDFIAQIDQLEARTGPIPPSARYHLETLGPRECREAISFPVEAFGIRYVEGACDKLIHELTLEDGRAEPSHLQIVCERLFQDWRQETDRPAGIGLDPIRRLGGVDGILGSYFEEFLKDLQDDDPEEAEVDKYEILNILEPLMTTSGLRNIAELDRLLSPGFRAPTRRRELFGRLVDARIVRTEQRFGGSFAEITHEFLLKHIARELARAKTEDRYYVPLASAIDKLERKEGRGYGHSSLEGLTQSEYEALWWYRHRLHIIPSDEDKDPDDESGRTISAKPWLASVLLREAAVASWLTASQPLLRTHVRHWAGLVDSASRLAAPSAKQILSAMSPDSGRLGLLELKSILQAGRSEQLAPAELEIVLRSAIRSGDRSLARAAVYFYMEKSHEAA